MKFARKLLTEFEIDDSAGRQLVTLAEAALRDWESAREALEKAGSVITLDRYGGLRQHPAIKVARDAEAAVLAVLRALNLDVPSSAAASGEQPSRFRIKPDFRPGRGR